MTTPSPAAGFPELFAKRERLTGLPPGGPEAGRLGAFLGLVRAGQRRARLVGDASAEELFLHAADSLMVLRADSARRLSPARCLDVGSGGGFPGVPLRLVRPEWTFTLLEAERKKFLFLEDALRRLGLNDCRALSGRAEELARAPEQRERYDLAFCRAVGGFTVGLELALPFLRVGGLWLAHRGEAGPREAEAASKALETLGGAVTEIFPYRLPPKERTRFIVCVKKVRPTPAAYPRRPGMPAKRPL